MATQAGQKDSLEEEMSRFEQEILGTASARPPPQPLMGAPPQPLMGDPPPPLMGAPPQPLMGAPPLIRSRPLLPEGGALLKTPDSGQSEVGGLLQTPTQTNSGLLQPPNQTDAPRPLFQPIGGPATGQSSKPQPLIPQAPSTNVSSTVNAMPRPLMSSTGMAGQVPTTSFVPRQALRPPPPLLVGAPVTSRPPAPLMGASIVSSSQSGTPRVPSPSHNSPPGMPPHGQNGPPGIQPPGQAGPPGMQPPAQTWSPGHNGPSGMPPPGQNAPPGMQPPAQTGHPGMPPPRMISPGQTGHPGMPHPDFNRPPGTVHPGMPPHGQPLRFPPPGMMAGHPGQPPPMFAPFPNALVPAPSPLFHQQHTLSMHTGQRGVAIPPPEMHSYPSRPSLATPLPLAIAQAVAGATISSGMSASGSGAGISLASVPIPTKHPKKTKDPKKLRVGGGKVWEDSSLDEWDPNDFRIFVGDLGNDVNDDTLARSFSRFPTFLKAKVIRDKYTKKTKGYGFVSFKDPKDFMQAMRDMNGKYIGNRPVKLRKSTWKDRGLLVVKKKDKEKKRLGFK